MTNPKHAPSTDNNRRTPAWLIEVAREVMGSIDLDPASDPEAQETVRAEAWAGNRYRSCPGRLLGPDGLVLDWSGRVWLNPPGGYVPDAGGHARGGSQAAAWWGKLQTEYLSGRVTQALFLAFSLNVFRTGQGCATYAPYEYPFVVFKERIRFPSSNGGTVESPRYDSALVYLPPRDGNTLTSCQRFAMLLSTYGRVRL